MTSEDCIFSLQLLSCWSSLEGVVIASVGVVSKAELELIVGCVVGVFC